MRREPAAAEAGMTLQQPEVHFVFSWGSCPWITGPWQWRVAQAPRRGGVESDLCLYANFLVAAAAVLAFHAHLWGPCSQPQLVPFSGGRLGGALNPLSSRTPKQWSLASLAAPDFFPDSLLASCGAIAPFRLCSHSQPQSSPWDLTSKARASAPSPHPPWCVSRQASQVGESWSALILCEGISPFCPLHPFCYAPLCGSKASPPPTPISTSEGASQCVESFPSSQLPPRGSGPILILLSLFFLFSFALPRYVGSFLPFGKSEVFFQHSVGVLQELFHMQMYF